MPKKTRSYTWANATHVADIPTRNLSHAASTGLDYARQLAEGAHAASLQNLRYYTPDPPPLTIADLAALHNVPAATIRRQIARARHQLFGEISDNAIHKRQHRARKPRPTPRDCAEDGCQHPLPPKRHGNRQYCDQHRTPAARTHRHRHAGS